MREPTVSCGRQTEVQPYLDGERSGAEKADFERHLGQCSSCAARLKSLRKVEGLVAEACLPGPEDKVHPRKVDLVMNRILGREGAPRWDAGTPRESPQTGWEAFFPPWKLAIPASAVALLLVVFWIVRGPGVPGPLPGTGPTGMGPAPAAISGSPGAGFVFSLRQAAGAVLSLTEDGQPFPGGPAASLALQKTYRVSAQQEIRLTCAPAMHLEIAGPARFVPGPAGLRLEAGLIRCSFAEPHPSFAVTTAFGTVESVGTRFSVEIHPDEMVVVVEDGRVRVAAGTRERFLAARDRVRVRRTGEIEPVGGAQPAFSSPPVQVLPPPPVVPTAPVDGNAAGSLNQSY